MTQTASMLVGAVCGVIIWALLRHSVALPGAFVSVVVSAWLAVGLYGLVRGSITLAGRGRRSPTTYSGISSRFIGAAICVGSIAFAAVMASLPG